MAPPVTPHLADRARLAHQAQAGRASRMVRALLGVGALAFLVLNPWFSWACPIRALAHTPCPGCGLTRAFLALASGRFQEAHAFHPLASLLPLGLGLFALELFGYVRSGRFGLVTDRRGFNGLAAAILALVIAVWLARFCGYFGGPVPR